MICADLGYPGVLSWSSIPHSLTTNHTAPVWLNYLGCIGTEASLNQCYKSNWGVARCYSRGVAVVNCSLSSAVEGEFKLALMDGLTDTSGRVEVNIHKIWGTICSLSSYGQDNIAKVGLLYPRGFLGIHFNTSPRWCATSWVSLPRTQSPTDATPPTQPVLISQFISPIYTAPVRRPAYPSATITQRCPPTPDAHIGMISMWSVTPPATAAPSKSHPLSSHPCQDLSHSVRAT